MYYYLSAHGHITDKEFVPNKAQTLVFFNLPGDVITSKRIAPLLFNLNNVSKKCHDIHKDSKKKRCQGLNKTHCQLDTLCKPIKTHKKYKCISNELKYRNPLSLVSNPEQCKDYTCPMCKLINTYKDYNISVYNSSRFQKGDKVPDLKLFFNLHNVFFKLGVYKLPNIHLDEYLKKKSKRISLY